MEEEGRLVREEGDERREKEWKKGVGVIGGEKRERGEKGVKEGRGVKEEKEGWKPLEGRIVEGRIEERGKESGGGEGGKRGERREEKGEDENETKKERGNICNCVHVCDVL